MIISSYEYELAKDEYYGIIVDALDNAQITPEKVSDIPALIFMLPSLMTDQTGPMVTQVVEQLSATYFVVMRERLDLQTCGAIFMGWSRAMMYN